jgi:hypothetical protein
MANATAHYAAAATTRDRQTICSSATQPLAQLQQKHCISEPSMYGNHAPLSNLQQQPPSESSKQYAAGFCDWPSSSRNTASKNNTILHAVWQPPLSNIQQHLRHQAVQQIEYAADYCH